MFMCDYGGSLFCIYFNYKIAVVYALAKTGDKKL